MENLVYVLNNLERKFMAIERIKEIDPETNPKMFVSIGEFKRNRKLEQNAEYWATLHELSSVSESYNGGLSVSAEAFHEFFKIKFLGYEAHAWKNEVFTRPRSTKKLSTKEFHDFREEVGSWIAEQGIVLGEKGQGRQGL